MTYFLVSATVLLALSFFYAMRVLVVTAIYNSIGSRYVYNIPHYKKTIFLLVWIWTEKGLVRYSEKWC